MEDIKDRLRIIMEKGKVPPKVFAETIGIQQSTLSHILNNRNKPSLEVIMKVHQVYNNISLEWLLYGKGNMIVGDQPEEKKDILTAKVNNFSTLFDFDSKFDLSQKRAFSGDSKKQEYITEEAKEKQPAGKKIIEIRVFFDDNTYETFTHT